MAIVLFPFLILTNFQAINAAADETITSEAIMAHIRVLTDEALFGRKAGTEFEKRSAEYVARQLEAAKIAPLKSGERFQTFNIGNDKESINVLGQIDPHTKQDRGIIVLGAHIDHLGTTEDGRFYPGADDNASGVAVILAVAKKLQAHVDRLSRTVVVAFWGAEEIGLLGSKHFVFNGPVDRQRIVAMVNIDMIGRPIADQAKLKTLKGLLKIDDRNGIGVVTNGRPAFTRIVNNACQKLDITAYGTQPVLAPVLKSLARNRSDHAPFERVGIPTMSFGSGESDDYHLPSDTIEKLDPKLMARRAEVVYHSIVAMASAPANKLPPRENVTIPSGARLQTEAALASQNLRGKLRDNSLSPKILSGIQSLFHSSTSEFDAFDPETQGASAGLNFEHIISGHRSAANSFTPRRGRYRLYRHPNQNAVSLVRMREDSPWDVASRLTYEIKEPHYVDFHFECTPYNARIFGKRRYAIFFFANYMNDVADPAIHFRGIENKNAPESWISADAPQGHPDWNQGGTYAHRDAAAIEYDTNHNFKLNSWSYEYPRFTQPFYYGRAANQMVFMLMFDRDHTDVDQIRFSLFKFKLPKHPRPAWDFQYVIHQVVEKRKYGFRGRLVWKPWVNQEDCQREFASWRGALRNQHPKE